MRPVRLYASDRQLCCEPGVVRARPRGAAEQPLVSKYVALLLDEEERRPMGTVTFIQDAADASSPTRVLVSLRGLPAGPHGLHVHEFGDISDGCMTAGAHWNPDGTLHGGRYDERGVRHVGDLGNVVAGSDGRAVEDFVVADLPLAGNRGILGRALVLHYGQDDLGRGNHEDSHTTGNSGGRMACGVIGVSK